MQLLQRSTFSPVQMDLRLLLKVCEENLKFRFPAHVFLFQCFSNILLILGGSCCIASVNGPLEVSPANLDMNKAYVDVIYRPKSGLPGVNERYKEKIVKSLCETSIITQLYPRTQITVQTQEMDDHGGVSSFWEDSRDLFN